MAEETELLKQLIEIESITGNEEKIGQFVFDRLLQNGFEMKKMVVDEKRFNVIATTGKPKIFLTAHLDTVPPFLPFRETKTHIFGRGSCDTKSCVATMITAGIKCIAEGLTNFGLLFTVGEEGSFDGAKKIVESGFEIPFAIVGEPTSLEVVNGHYGMMVLEITAKGKASHSSRPEEGVNAIDKMFEAMAKIKTIRIEENTLMSLVKVNGGMADNIIPARACLTMSFRVHPLDKSNYYEKIKSLLGEEYLIEKTLETTSVYNEVPKEVSFIKKWNTVKYSTDLSILKYGVVIGPGDIKYAHAENENISKKELAEAVGVYQQIIRNYN